MIIEMKLTFGHARPAYLPTVRCSHDRVVTAKAVTMAVPSENGAHGCVAERWPEYQGCRNWEGLLDPLDPNMRSEILRYGKFARAAYKAFDFDPSSLTYATCKYPRQEMLTLSGLTESGYVPTKNLHATSGVQLPRWSDRAPAWLTRQSSWIGFVAVADEGDTVADLGRRDIVIAYRGTVTCLEWLENMRSMLTRLTGDGSAACPQPPGLESCSTPMVLSGFWSLFTSRPSAGPSLQEEVREEVGRLLERYKGEPISLTVTGHSLGAALAVLTADDIATTFRHYTPAVTVYSFGGPRVGNRSFRRQVERHGSKVLRIVNNQDVVTKVPGFVLDDNDDDDNDDEVTIPSPCDQSHHHLHPRLRYYQQLQAELMKKLVDGWWSYSEVGRELRLYSGRKPATNVATCHELDFYLNLVNGAS